MWQRLVVATCALAVDKMSARSVGLQTVAPYNGVTEETRSVTSAGGARLRLIHAGVELVGAVTVKIAALLLPTAATAVALIIPAAIAATAAVTSASLLR